MRSSQSARFMSGRLGRWGLLGDRLSPCATNREAFPVEQTERLVKGQADHARIGSDDAEREAAGETLDGVGARFAVPLAVSEIGGDLGLRQALEPYPRLDETLAPLSGWSDQADGRIYPMGSAREQGQAAFGLPRRLGFWQDTTPDRDDGIGGEQEA